MLLAIALSFQAGIIVDLVDGLAVQIRQPRFDVSSGDEDGYSLVRLSTIQARFHGGIVNLLNPFCHVSKIRIDYHHERLLDAMLSRSVVGKFLRKPRPHELLS